MYYAGCLLPMVSFCDIPLSEIQSHTEKYGSFAIGLTRDWAQRNKLNPVVYIDKNSNLGFGLENILDFIFLDWHEWLEDNEFDNFYKTAYKGGINIIYSSKNYEARLTRKGVDKNHIFYNEREWRYIPQINDKHIIDYPDIFWESDFRDLEKKFPLKPHFSNYGIEIKSSDINHIVIPDTSYIKELLPKLKTISNLYENEDDFYNLITNIITLDKIKEDF